MRWRWRVGRVRELDVRARVRGLGRRWEAGISGRPKKFETVVLAV